ncbi:hypothetical protein ACFVTP_13185 [Streptomyces celluloflavus]|uniref:hypothetical protein n=1 Tax=Streptomyces celluloflavus TaxID=58344 RepID=UPI0036DA5DC8
MAPLTSWADALQQHSPDQLLTLMREKRNEVHDTGRALDHIIATLEGIVTSNALWEKVTVPGPRPGSSAEHENGDHAEQAPGGPTDDAAEDLASHAEDRLGDWPEDVFPKAPGKRGYGRWGHPPRRLQILKVLSKDPTRWWPAQELSEAIGVDHHRQLRGLLSEMVRGGDLMRHKESAGIPASYRPAPTPAQQEEKAMSG